MTPLPLTRRQLLAAAPTALALGAVRAQDGYPNRPIRVIVPFTAGSIGDLFLRALMPNLAGALGQPLVIDNKPGASQAIGAELAARAAPDGHTLFLGTQSGLVLTTVSRKKLPYDPVADLAPVTMLFVAPLYLYVNPSVPARTVQELIALAKAQPGKLSFASIGPGSASHLAGETFKTLAGVDLLHVPYKGGPEATNALVGGQVDVFFNGGNTMPQVKQGKARVLAVASLKRSEEQPELPTVAESGVPGFQSLPWFGLFTPAGVPRAIVERLNREFVAQLKSPAAREKAAQLGIEVVTSTPDALGQQLKAEIPVMERIARRAGIQAE